MNRMSDAMAGLLVRHHRVALPVLVFHRVAEPAHVEVGLAPVPPAQFQRYLRWIADSRFTPVSSSDWLSWLRTGQPFLKRPALITFDDAYAELERNALPALAEARMPATVFIPTDVIGATNRWDGPYGFTQLPLMDQEAIESWSRRGISFGSHGASHADLTTLSPSALTAELERSAHRLREITGTAPEAIAYPYGIVNDSVAVEAARFFSLGFTIRAGLNNASTDLLRLRRVAVPPAASWLRFRFLLAFGIDPVLYIRAIVRPRLWLRMLGTRLGLVRK